MVCEIDGLLDRFCRFPSKIGSSAWLTNLQKGSYAQAGTTSNWEYFVKIVAAPADATATDGVWNNSDGIEIGPSIWGSSAIIQQVENDPCAGIHGLQYHSPDHSSRGNW